MAIEENILSFREKLKNDPIIDEVDAYLKASEEKYTPAQPEFGGRLALMQAKQAFLAGNYGVGAALSVLKPTQTEIYFGQNKVVTGKPTERFNTHGETDAIKKWLASLENGVQPDLVFINNNPSLGIRIFVNLEPCPKCEMEITMLLGLAKEYIHSSARIHCISLSTDGSLEVIDGGVACGSGSAHTLGRKSLTSPLVWRSIQRGFFPGQEPPTQPPVQFSLLHTSPATLEGYEPPGAYIPTADHQLVKLGWDIFSETRAQIDQFLISNEI